MSITRRVFTLSLFRLCSMDPLQSGNILIHYPNRSTKDILLSLQERQDFRYFKSTHYSQDDTQRCGLSIKFSYTRVVELQTSVLVS